MIYFFYKYHNMNCTYRFLILCVLYQVKVHLFYTLRTDHVYSICSLTVKSLIMAQQRKLWGLETKSLLEDPTDGSFYFFPLEQPKDMQALTLSMLRILLSKGQECKYFWKSSKPYHIGIHWIALAEYSQMSTHLPGFQSFFRFFASFLLWPN